MIDDKDLNFLAKLESQQLDSLVEILINDKDGKKRLSESLTNHSLYIENQPNHQKYWHLIADEIQRFGGNSLMTAVRGKGVPYSEIVADVAEKLGIDVEKLDCVRTIERNILLKIMTTSISEFSPQQLHALVDELDLKTSDLTSSAVGQALNLAMTKNGFITSKVARLISAAMTKELFGKSLKITANIAITRALSSLLGPVGWLASSALTASDIAGPAYRVTIPAVIQVALLRAQLEDQTAKSDHVDPINPS